MTAKNETLEYREEQNKIIGQVRGLPAGAILPNSKQDIFYDLHDLSGEAYQNKLKEAMPEQLKKVNWVMKTKLSSD